MRPGSLAAVAAAALLLPSAASADPFPLRSAAVGWEEKGRRLVITTPAYRLALSKRTGALLELVDAATGARLARGATPGCLWAAVPAGGGPALGGCGGLRSYRWERLSSTLMLEFSTARLRAVLRLRADTSSFDLVLSLENRSGGVLEKVTLPSDLQSEVAAVTAGYAPNVLPGVRLAPAFFGRVGDGLNLYPSRWAFADYVSLDLARTHLAVATVNRAPAPVRPVELGFVHTAPPGPCSGPSFCTRHAFRTWIPSGGRWQSPVVRVRVGGTAQSTILAYRRDNGIAAYPALEEKVGARLETLARAPLVKADVETGLGPFDQWEDGLARLPQPSLVHPVAFQPRGHDESFPDFLPPDPRWGGVEQLRATVEQARRHGLLVMPYANVSWWDDESPSLLRVSGAEVAVRDEQGRPVYEEYNGHGGYVVSAHATAVRERVDRLMEEWRAQVPVDCVFFDQIGARPWLRDFHPSGPDPLAYYDGWLSLMQPFAQRCLMVEDGWDRLARDYAGFHGGLLMMHREHDLPDERWGEGNWEPYPLAVWLFHDKLLMYQHDLFEGTMADDAEVVAWNLAFGLVHSYDWNERLDAPLDSPWLELVGTLQRTLGPRYVGRPLSRYRELAGGVTESDFGDLVVVANRGGNRSFEVDGYELAPHGFLARGEGVVAGAFTGSLGGVELSPGTHYLVVEEGERALTVRQPLGRDTALAVELPEAWRADAVRAVAVDEDGRALGPVDGTARDGRFTFEYRSIVSGRPVDAYRLEELVSSSRRTRAR